MNKFWTITDANTTHTNSRSERFSSLGSALSAAAKRIERGAAESVCVMECVKLVKRAAIPAVVEDVTTIDATSDLED